MNHDKAPVDSCQDPGILYVCMSPWGHVNSSSSCIATGFGRVLLRVASGNNRGLNNWNRVLLEGSFEWFYKGCYLRYHPL